MNKNTVDFDYFDYYDFDGVVYEDEYPNPETEYGYGCDCANGPDSTVIFYFDDPFLYLLDIKNSFPINR